MHVPVLRRRALPGQVAILRACTQRTCSAPMSCVREAADAVLWVQIVERWAGSPGAPSGTPKKGMCHPIALAQHAHRVQMLHPRAQGCVSQALASHPHQATVLSGSAPGYVHAWRYSDGSLKATYAPLPLSHQLVEASSSSVPQPSQVMHWTYAMSIAYCLSLIHI